LYGNLKYKQALINAIIFHETISRLVEILFLIIIFLIKDSLEKKKSFTYD